MQPESLRRIHWNYRAGVQQGHRYFYRCHPPGRCQLQRHLPNAGSSHRAHTHRWPEHAPESPAPNPTGQHQYQAVGRAHTPVVGQAPRWVQPRTTKEPGAPLDSCRTTLRSCACYQNLPHGHPQPAVSVSLREFPASISLGVTGEARPPGVRARAGPPVAGSSAPSLGAGFVRKRGQSARSAQKATQKR